MISALKITADRIADDGLARCITFERAQAADRSSRTPPG